MSNPIGKPALGQRSTSQKHVTSMSCELEPTIWSRENDQRVPCFDKCQLILAWMSNIKDVHGKPRLYVSLNILLRASMAAMLGNSAVVAVVVVRKRPQAIPLAMLTMRKSTHGFPFHSYMSMGIHLAALRVAGTSLLKVECLLSFQITKAA